MSIPRKYLKFLVDVSVTMVLWVYFTLGFVVLFSLFYVAAYFFSRDTIRSFQKLNHLYLRSFFWLLQTIAPGLAIHVDERIKDLRACVIVSNHRSYLDPLLLVSTFERHSTIVKSDFFRVPIFGRIVKASGYLPSSRQGNLASLLIRRVKYMCGYLSEGGVLFVFPEGTRTRDGRIGRFNKGAFKIARRCDVPIDVICMTNTEKLFPPGRFFFNTCVDNRIEVRWVGRIVPNGDGQVPMEAYMTEARDMMNEYMDSRSIPAEYV